MKTLKFLKNLNFRNFNKISEFNIKKFSTTNKRNESHSSTKISSQKLEEFREKLLEEGQLKIHESIYKEDILKKYHSRSLIIYSISGYIFLFTDISLYLKLVNFVFLLLPISCNFLYIMRRHVGTIIKSIFILPDGKVKVIDMWDISDIIEIEHLKRTEGQEIQFINKNNGFSYIGFKSDEILDEYLFYNTIEGQKLL